MNPPLNWREIELLVGAIRKELGESLHLERIVAPERSRFPSGYLKAEWALQLKSRSRESWFVFSVRARKAYLALYPAKALKPAPTATRSPFDGELAAQLNGARLTEIVVPPRERIVILWFGELGLVILLIPAGAEALLIRRSGEIVTSTKKNRKGMFEVPGGSKAPPDPPVREALSSPLDFYKAINAELMAEAFELRTQTATKELNQLAKHARERARQSETAVHEAQKEVDWKRYGELLKASLHELEEPVRGTKKDSWFRRVKDFETGETVEIPSDPKYGPSEQVERFFQLARRKARRAEEAGIRLKGFQETLARVKRLLENPPAPLDWAALEALESAAGIAAPSVGDTRDQARAKVKRGHRWMGKIFQSKDGLPIWVGRSKDENLELTFKHTKGNDLWMHVRGKPGAHVVIPLQSGKSPPLETLLDAAALAVHYSGGQKLGKTEVDYTFKKHVKRIRDSSEASYTHNKTLIIAPDSVRLKRLLGTDS